jgi:hypothetical protein
MLSRNVRIVGDSAAKLATAILKKDGSKCNIAGTKFTFGGETVDDCAYQCKAATGCNNFNYSPVDKLCEWAAEFTNGCLNAGVEAY